MDKPEAKPEIVWHYCGKALRAIRRHDNIRLKDIVSRARVSFSSVRHHRRIENGEVPLERTVLIRILALGLGVKSIAIINFVLTIACEDTLLCDTEIEELGLNDLSKVIPDYLLDCIVPESDLSQGAAVPYGRLTWHLKKAMDEVEKSPVGIYAYDCFGRVKVWNPAAERIFGWNKEEMINREPPPSMRDELFPGHTVSTCRSAWKCVTGRKNRKDGSRVNVTMVHIAIWHQSNHPVFGTYVTLAFDSNFKQGKKKAAVIPPDWRETAYRAWGLIKCLAGYMLLEQSAEVLGYTWPVEADKKDAAKYREYLLRIYTAAAFNSVLSDHPPAASVMELLGAVQDVPVV